MASIQNRAEIMNKIRGLLNKTVENGATEAESQNAMAMANRLMILHAIDSADVSLSDVGDHANLYGEHVASESGSMGAHLVALIPVLEMAFAVRVVVRKEVAANERTGRVVQRGVKLCVFGDVHSCVAAKWGAEFLAATFLHLWDCYRAKNTVSRADREQFFHGLSHGMLNRLRTEQNRIFLELPNSRGSLVVVRNRLDDAFGEAYPERRLVKKEIATEHAYLTGLAKGEEINLSRPIEQAHRSQLEG